MHTNHTTWHGKGVNAVIFYRKKMKSLAFIWPTSRQLLPNRLNIIGHFGILQYFIAISHFAQNLFSNALFILRA